VARTWIRGRVYAVCQVLFNLRPANLGRAALVSSEWVIKAALLLHVHPVRCLGLGSEVTHAKRIKLLVRTLASRPNFARLVEEVSFRAEAEGDVDWQRSARTQSQASMLSLCPSLTDLVVDGERGRWQGQTRPRSELTVSLVSVAGDSRMNKSRLIRLAVG